MKLMRFWKMFNQQAEKCGFADISSDEEETIMHCRKSLLFNNSDIWIKKRAARILMLLWVALTAQKFATWLMFVFYIY